LRDPESTFATNRSVIENPSEKNRRLGNWRCGSGVRERP
jgi:hypothetical protein